MAFVMESWPAWDCMQCAVVGMRWRLRWQMKRKVQPRFIETRDAALFNITSDHQSSFKSQSKNHNLLHFNNIFIVCYFNKHYMEFTFLHFSLSLVDGCLPSCLFPTARWKVHWDSMVGNVFRSSHCWRVFSSSGWWFIWWSQRLLHKCNHHYSYNKTHHDSDFIASPFPC